MPHDAEAFARAIYAELHWLRRGGRGIDYCRGYRRICRSGRALPTGCARGGLIFLEI